MRESILAAERRCEEALADLKHARTSLQATIAQGTGFTARRQLRKRFREARRSAQAALEHWQELGGAYLEEMSGTIFATQPG